MADKTITGRVIDQEGNPVAGVEVGLFWSWRDGGMQPGPGVQSRTDDIGLFTLTTPWYGKAQQALMAMDQNRQYGGYIILSEENIEQPATIALQPLVHLHGRFRCSELNAVPMWTNVMIHTLPDRAGHKVRLAECQSLEAQFNLSLPAGTYEFYSYGSEFELLAYRNKPTELELTDETCDQDLGIVDLAPTNLARHIDHVLPDWHVTAARGVAENVQLSDYRGKWVLLEFWADWCGPCTHRGLPELMEFYDKHPQLHDRFEVLTFHHPSGKTFEEIDEKLAPIIEDVWQGQDLPFPILLDATGTTFEEYGITSLDTLLFIDPEGRVKNLMNLEQFVATLQSENQA